MLTLKIDQHFFQQAERMYGSEMKRFSTQKRAMDILENFCKDLEKNKFTIYSNSPSKEDLMNNPFLEELCDRCKDFRITTNMDPLPDHLTQMALLNFESDKTKWIQEGYLAISAENLLQDTESFEYSFDIDCQLNDSFQKVEEHIKKISINFNTLIIVDKFINKNFHPYFLQEIILSSFMQSNKSKNLEIILISDCIDQSKIQEEAIMLYEKIKIFFNNDLHHQLYVCLFNTNIDEIHDRRIWTNFRQFYSGHGFSGFKKGFLKKNSFRTEITKDSKIQFKNQVRSKTGLSDLENAMKYFKKLIGSQKNSLFVYPNKQLKLLNKIE